MKQETLKWVKDAYKTEAECKTEMLNYFDEKEFANISRVYFQFVNKPHAGLVIRNLRFEKSNDEN